MPSGHSDFPVGSFVKTEAMVGERLGSTLHARADTATGANGYYLTISGQIHAGRVDHVPGVMDGTAGPDRHRTGWDRFGFKADDRVVEHRARTLVNARSTITEDKLTAFTALMREKLSSGDIAFRKNYLRTILGTVEVDSDKVRLIGSKNILQAAVANENLKQNGVQSSRPKWRAQRESNAACDYHSQSDLEFGSCIIHIQT